MTPTVLKFLASSPRGLGDLLARELGGFGAQELRERSTGVAFTGTLESAYRACLWSRLANRVFLELGSFEARDAEEFHAAVCRIDWTAHLAPGATLACDFSGRHPAITHTHFGALKLKDGIVDALREATGARPDVALERPDVRVHAHAHGAQLTLAIDLAGESLHRRGYRGDAGEAPLKENVAAGVLLRAYVYMRMLGREGMQRVGEYATLNANYLSVRLQQAGYKIGERILRPAMVAVSKGGPKSAGPDAATDDNAST